MTPEFSMMREVKWPRRCMCNVSENLHEGKQSGLITNAVPLIMLITKLKIYKCIDAYAHLEKDVEFLVCAK